MLGVEHEKSFIILLYRTVKCNFGNFITVKTCVKRPLKIDKTKV